MDLHDWICFFHFVAIIQLTNTLYIENQQNP